MDTTASHHPASSTRYNLFILGSPNSPDGVLSPTSIGRIAKAIELQRVRPEIVILATGGFGCHFNTSTTPHRELLHSHLCQQGALIDRAKHDDLLSSNTVEDAVMILAFAESQAPPVRWGVVTSNFHAARCRFIFDCLAGPDVVDLYIADDADNLEPEVTRHETVALAQLWDQGGVMIGNVLHPHVSLS
jgi:uncharacterized SAM-binding protein YcdF (DUF218 family)